MKTQPKNRRRNTWIGTIFAIAIVFAISTSRLYAQGYGTISGIVTDPTGAVVASAT
jgi:hypothetical protein